MELSHKGKQVVLDASYPSITLLGDPERIPHTIITLNDDGFILQNLNERGTLIRAEDKDETLNTAVAILKGVGIISLSQSFDAESQIIEYTVHA